MSPPRSPRCASTSSPGDGPGRWPSGTGPRPPWPGRCCAGSPAAPVGAPVLAGGVDTGRLAPGRYGLLEPLGPGLGPTAIGTADVVVVPALAVARNGVRLGRGGGYYDRALQHARPDAVVVALVFDDEFVDELPTEPHDRPVTAVVT